MSSLFIYCIVDGMEQIWKQVVENGELSDTNNLLWEKVLNVRMGGGKFMQRSLNSCS